MIDFCTKRASASIFSRGDFADEANSAEVGLVFDARTRVDVSPPLVSIDRKVICGWIIFFGFGIIDSIIIVKTAAATTNDEAYGSTAGFTALAAITAAFANSVTAEADDSD